MPSIPRIDYQDLLFTAPKALHDAWRLRGFIDAPLQNGVGRYVCQLQRITIIFCKSHVHSAGVRHFIEHRLVDFAEKGAGVAVYVEPRRFTAPKAIGEYLNGRKVQVPLSDASTDQVNKWLHYLLYRSGNRIVAFERNSSTQTPSIQGVWNPWCNRDSELAIEKWPSKKYSQHVRAQLTATDILRRAMQEHQQT